MLSHSTLFIQKDDVCMSKDHNLGLLLKFIHNAIDRDCNSMLREMNLTPAQLDILMYLIKNRDPEVNQKDIEKAFQVKNPTVTGILKRLERKGMVRRVVDSNDGRYKRIIVTHKSLDMEKRILQKGKQIERRITDSLSTEEQEQLRGLLMRVLDNLM